jgi:hypothetical protein
MFPRPTHTATNIPFTALPVEEPEDERAFKDHVEALEIDSSKSVSEGHRHPQRLLPGNDNSLSRCKGAIKFCRKRFILVTLAAGALASILITITYEMAYGTSCKGILGDEYNPPLKILEKYNLSRGTSEKPFRVLLYGDRLISRTKINLPEAITKFLPQYHLKFTQYPFSEVAGISELSKSLEDVLYDAADDMGGVDAVILFWDTDVSDTDWYQMSREDKVKHREKYVKSLTRVVKGVRSRDPAPLLAIAGPEVSGEGPLFAPIKFNGVDYDYFRVYKMYEDYRIINRATCAVHNLPYIDVRRAFLDATPWLRFGFKGCLTADGESESEEGSMIVAKLFAETILGWLNIDEIRSLNVTSKYVSQIYTPVEYYLW